MITITTNQKLYISPQQLAREYLIEGNSLQTLAIKYDVNRGTILYKLREANDPRVFEKLEKNKHARKRKPEEEVIMCLECRKCGEIHNITERKYNIYCECGQSLIVDCMINHKGCKTHYMSPKLREQESIMRFDKWR